MQRQLLTIGLIGFLTLSISLPWKTRPTPAQPTADPPGKEIDAPAPALAIGQVILFSSGVGYFQREGVVEGNARVELSFPGSDVNDLLKSLVLQDLGGGKISTITYDSPDPVEKTLKSFALDLTNNPTFGQLLNQARGEKIEVTIHQTTIYPQASLTGVVVGMESHPAGLGQPEVDMLNLLCADGLRSVNLAHIQRVRFLSPLLDNEFKRALEVLAGAHDTQKKAVILGFNGAGKRRVRVGYVIDNPIWKTSYRLVLRDKDKPHLQGWAIIENRSDEDWKHVRIALVSGRPISFQMGLYEPLYVPRPWVEPDLFASLRPPVYSGALASAGPVGGFGGGQGLGGLGLGGLGLGGGLGQQGGGPNLGPNANLGQLGGQQGLSGGWNRYQPGFQGQLRGGVTPEDAEEREGEGPPAVTRKLTYEELQKRRQQREAAREKAKKAGSSLAAVDPTEGIASLASAEEIGDQFQYAIDQKVTLPRQKSALLPIVNEAVEATRVTIFNESLHSKFPILGLKFKNTSGHPLVQGPITVYESGNYAGDARILDLQPNEERLIGYAMDLGTEIKTEGKTLPSELVAAKIVKGIVHTSTKLQQTKTYLIRNRSEHDRLLLIEHPVRSDWKLITPERPAERSRDLYRFQLMVAAGKTARQQVVEEKTRFDRLALTSTDEQEIRFLLKGTGVSPQVKEALKKAMDLKIAWTSTQAEAGSREAELKGITEDQTRLRANLGAVPAASAAYKRYLSKFDTQESQIEKVQAEIKQLRATAKRQQQEYEDYLASLNLE
jgi:hypothetical protein